MKHPVLGRLAGLIPPFAGYEGPPPQTLLAFARWCLRGSGKALALGAVVAILSGTVEVVSAMLLGLIIDRSVAAGPERLFSDEGWFLLFAAGFLVVLRPLIFGAQAAMQAVALNPSLNVLILSRLHRWTLGQAVTFFDNDFAGRIAQKQMQASRALTEVTVEFLNTVIFALASVLATAALIVTIDWKIALLLAAWLIAYLRFITFYLPRIRGFAMKRAAARAVVSGQVVDTITNMRTVKLFAHDEHEDRAAIGAMQTYRDRTTEFGYASTTFRTLLVMLAGTVPVMLVGATLWLWTQGAATAGDIAATGAVALRIAQMTGWVSFSIMGIYANVGEVEDGMHTLTPMHTLTDAPDAVPLEGPATIEFRDVSFGYGRKVGGVQSLNLRVSEGERLGIVGASGAGKSTMVALLLRLYDVEDGAVLIGGQDIRKVTQESLRRKIGMVTQETAMFNRSALDNILYGRPDASEDEVVAAAEAAEAHEFIGTLEDFKGRTGYGAYLGERGVKLSGGQRQRIALARAILKDAPILVLDEATSALDSEVEAEIQESLNTVMQGKTVLAIAHRLSTLAHMDRIVVLDDGRIVEEGRHADLLAQGGLYARYWNRQSGGFLITDEAAE
jgi:ATP-binding cassette subfamily B protein